MKAYHLAVIGSIIAILVVAGIMTAVSQKGLMEIDHYYHATPKDDLRIFLGWCMPGIAVATLLVFIRDPEPGSEKTKD